MLTHSSLEIKAKSSGVNSSGVVILGGAHGALSVARSFGRLDIPVFFVTSDHPLPKLSRFVTRSFEWPGAASSKASEWLSTLAANYDLHGWLLIPCADAEVKYVAEHLAQLRIIFKVVGRDWKTLRKLCDKRLLTDTAIAAGLSIPTHYHLRLDDDIERAGIRFPVILKPAMRLERNELTSSKAWRVNSAYELRKLHAHASSIMETDEVIVQEMIPGGGEAQFSYVALWHANNPIVEMSARRTRQYPIEFGHTSTFVEVVDNDEVKIFSRKLLSSIGFEGLVEIEFKRDARDNTYKILDVNPRPWSWFELSEAMGLEFCRLLYSMAFEKAHQRSPMRSDCIAWMHFSRDAVAAAQLILRNDLSVSNYFKSFRRGLTFAAFSLDDPIPGLMEFPLTAYRVVRRYLSERPLGRPPRA